MVFKKTVERFAQKPMMWQMEKLGYSPRENGVCHGLSMMLIQAVAQGDVDGFEKRIELLGKYYHREQDLAEQKGRQGEKTGGNA